MKTIKLIPALLLIAFIYSCSSPKKEKENITNPQKESIVTNKVVKEITNEEFKDFLSNLSFIEIPYETSCDSNYKQDYEMSEELIEKFSERKFQYPYKRVYTPENFEIVIFLSPADVIIPIVRTFDLNGNPIASEQMFHGYCGGEPGYYHTEHIQIVSPDLITHIDSTWTHEVDEDYNEIKGTEKFKLEVYDFIINKDGTITKKEE